MKKAELKIDQKIKKNIWEAIYPFFHWLQTHLLKWHLIWHKKGRQPYHLGWLVPGETLQDLEKHLKENWNFGNHFVAWHDDDQVLSWRKMQNFDFQYHLRVYKDGEIRGHFEYTPENRPIDHFTEVGEKPKRKDFKKFLGNFLTEKKYISHLISDMKYKAKSEISVDQF